MKINFLRYTAIALLGGMIFFTGCKDDPEDPITYDDPTVTIEQGASIVLVPADGPTFALSLDVNIVAPGKINEIKIQRSKMLGENLIDEFEIINQEHFDKTETNFNFTDEINFDPFFAGTIDKIVYEFIVTDRESQMGTVSYTITMGEYTALTTEFADGEIWKLHGKGKACWNLKENVEVTAVGNADEVVAARYLINSDNENSFETESNFTGSWTSDEVTWTPTNSTEPLTTKGNGTLYVKANGYDYEKAPKEVALHLFSTGDKSTNVENPEIGDIYIGKLDDELYVIKITDKDIAADPTKANTGILKFSYKK